MHTHVDESLATVVVPSSFDSPEVRLRPGDARTLALSASHFLTDRIAIELDLGVPPYVEAYGSGRAAPPGPAGVLLDIDLGDPAINPLGSQRQWSPVLALQYRFRPGTSLRPFLLGGVTYTWFTDTQVNPAFSQRLDERFGQFLALGAGRPGPTSAHADTPATWAPVAGAGAALDLGDGWGALATVAVVPFSVQPSLEIRAADGTPLSRTTAHVDVDAVAVTVGVSYRLRRGSPGN